MTDKIDIYCERLDGAFWAEPINAITNLSFIIAAFLAYRLAREHNALDIKTSILIALIAIIGIGSFLFHTLATFWAMMSDVIPILLYQIAFLAFYARTVMKLSIVKTTAFMALFFLSVFIAGSLPKDLLNGSLGYAPALLFTLGLGVYHAYTKKTERWVLLGAAATFIASLSFRIIDIDFCPAWPLGTHFMWHILNGLVLYLTARAYLRNS